MSYILDALNKAERERGIQPPPGLPKVPESRRGERAWKAMAAAGIVIGAGAMLFFMPPPFWKAGPQEAMPGSGNPGVEREAESTPAKAGPVPPAGTIAGLRSAHNQDEAAPGSRPTNSATNPAPQKSAQTAQLPGASGRKPAVNPQSFPATPNSAAVEKEPPAAVNAAVPPVKETPPDPAAVQAAPLPLREAIAKMALNILYYHDDEVQRLVYINGKKYARGDYIDGLYLVESIAQEGVWLRYGGQRLLLK